MPSQALERRCHHRVPCRLLLREIEHGRVHTCEATNISESGIYLRRKSGGVLLEGEVVQVAFRLPGDDEGLVWASGQVVAQVEEVFHDAAAVEFVGLTGGDRGRIRAFVSARRRAVLRQAVSGVRRLIH